MVEAVVDAIADGPVGEDGGEAAPAGLDQGRLAAHVQEAVVLAGEAGGRQILRRGRAADGDGQSPPPHCSFSCR